MGKNKLHETLTSELWGKVNLNDNLKKELYNLEIYSIEDFMKRYNHYDLDLSNNPYIYEFIVKNGEVIATLKERYLPENVMSIQINYKGKNIFGYSLIPVGGHTNLIYESLKESFSDLLLIDCQPLLYIAAADPSHANHISAKKRLIGACSISSSSQIYSRFALAAAFLTEDLVNRALIASDCLTLDEMKAIAEADEFNEQDSV